MRVIIACGGSGGHIFPGIAVAQELKRMDRDCQILLAGSHRSLDRKILEEENFAFVIFPTYPMPEGISFKFIPFSLMLAFVLIKSFVILKKTKPHLVLGLGGFISGPLLLSAYILRIPTIIHEQNVLPGRTNVILAKFVDAIAISFEKSSAFFEQKCKLVFTGNPIRDSLNIVGREEAAKTFNLDSKKFTVLVMGGSQGAHSINQSIIEVFQRFNKEELKRLQIIHISGDGDYNMLQKRYRDLGIELRLFSFLDKINYAYSACDLIISRAGATTVSEIIYFGKPSILIPYPYAKFHQYDNATYVVKKGMGILLEDNEGLVEHLYDKMLYFYNNKDETKKYLKTPGTRDAAKDLADLVINLKSDDKN